MDMKRLKFILGLVAGTAVLSMMGCDLSIRDGNKYEPEGGEVKQETDGSYSLNYDKQFTATIGGETAIDAFNYQSTITHDKKPFVYWESPLYGKSAEDLKEGITIQLDMYNADSVNVNGYDAMVTLYNPDDAWNAVAIMEGGGLHINSSTIGGYYDYTSNLKKDVWTTYTLIFTTDGKIKFYHDNTKVVEDSFTAFPGNTTSYDTVVKYFTETASLIGVGVGFAAPDDGDPGLWLAGYIDTPAGIKNIHIYPKAIEIENEVIEESYLMYTSSDVSDWTKGGIARIIANAGEIEVAIPNGSVVTKTGTPTKKDDGSFDYWGGTERSEDINVSRAPYIVYVTPLKVNDDSKDFLVTMEFESADTEKKTYLDADTFKNSWMGGENAGNTTAITSGSLMYELDHTYAVTFQILGGKATIKVVDTTQ